MYDTPHTGLLRRATASHGNNRRTIHADRANALVRPLCGYVGGIGSRALNPNLHLSTLKRFSNRMYRIPARTGTLCAQKRDRDCAHFSVNTPRNSPSFSLASFRSSCFETSRFVRSKRTALEKKATLGNFSSGVWLRLHGTIEAWLRRRPITIRVTADNAYCYRTYKDTPNHKVLAVVRVVRVTRRRAFDPIESVERSQSANSVMCEMMKRERI